MYVRRLDKHGVRLASITQQLGDDPSQVMMRRVVEIASILNQLMRRTKVTQIYRKAGKVRAVQLLLGQLESTVRYLGIEVDDALDIAERIEL